MAGVAGLVGFEASEPVDAMGERKGVIPAASTTSQKSRSSSRLPRCQHRSGRSCACQLRNRAANAEERGVKATAKDLRAQLRRSWKEWKKPRKPSQTSSLSGRIRFGRVHPRAGKPFKVDNDRILAPTFPSRLPKTKDDGELYEFITKENAPGISPTAGVFPFKRTDELSARMFAGEGELERTNRRFHYQAKAKTTFVFPRPRLGLALRTGPRSPPDIWGRSAIPVFPSPRPTTPSGSTPADLCDANTSVSMTINGPAPIILAFFLNAPSTSRWKPTWSSRASR